VAESFDPKQEGGVHKALKEWTSKYPDDLEFVFFEQPVWENPCGLFLGKKI